MGTAAVNLQQKHMDSQFQACISHTKAWC